MCDFKSIMIKLPNSTSICIFKLPNVNLSYSQCLTLLNPFIDIHDYPNEALLYHMLVSLAKWWFLGIDPCLVCCNS